MQKIQTLLGCCDKIYCGNSLATENSRGGNQQVVEVKIMFFEFFCVVFFFVFFKANISLDFDSLDLTRLLLPRTCYGIRQQVSLKLEKPQRIPCEKIKGRLTLKRNIKKFNGSDACEIIYLCFFRLKNHLILRLRNCTRKKLQMTVDWQRLLNPCGHISCTNSTF